MSYDLQIGVKIADTDIIYPIAEPERDSPTYNLGVMFRMCTNWNFAQGYWYKVESVIEKICNGITELRTKPNKYRVFEPKNKWGTVESAIQDLESLRNCIYETAENIPIEHLWVRW